MNRKSTPIYRLLCVGMLSAMAFMPAAGAWEVTPGTVVLDDLDLVGGYCFSCDQFSCWSTGNSGQLCDTGTCYGDCAVTITDSSQFSLSTDLVVTGRIIDESEDPVSNQTVRISLPTNQVFDVTTDNDGVWSKFLC